MTCVRVHVLVKGIVQGVGYRYSTKFNADRIGLAGWVRNLANGDVEAVFEGDKDSVDSMVDWCRKGPSMSRVDKVIADYEEPEGLSVFSIV